MATAILFPSDPEAPVCTVEMDDPAELSAYFLDMFAQVRGQGWTAYIVNEAVPLSESNPRGAAFLDAHQAEGRTDWHMTLLGPMLVFCSPRLIADPLTPELRAYLDAPEETASAGH